MDITRLLKTGFKLTTISSFFFWTVAIAEPQGGVVAAGSANISQQNSQTVINQTSQSAVINWSSFNTTASESVLFNQPNSSAIALNKINSGLPTNFNGSLNANGQVWIINPAGVLFGSSSNINVAGLLATTHNIGNSDFMSGSYNFSSPTNLSASIINNGNITAANSGMVALVAPSVINNGVITANLGKVYLSSGSSFVLDLYGDSLINFGSNPNLSTSYVSNSGLIKADGGKVYMTAHAASGILDNVVSMSGVIEANAVSVNQQGEVVLHGGDAGSTVVSGKIKASQGHVETSGHVLMIEPTAEITAGNWLIDPADLTISTGANSNVTGSSPFQPTAASSVLNVTTLQNALASGNVTVQTNNDGFAGSGNITVANGVTWSSGNSLTLQAFNNIIINAAVNGGATGSVNLTAGGSISQALAGVITANTLTTSSVTGTALSTATNIVSNFSATNTTSGNISFNNNIASLAVNSISEQTGGTLTVTNTGNMVFNNPYVVTGTTTFTSSAGNIIFNNTVNDLSALGHTLNLSGTVFPTFSSTPGGTTRFGTLSIAESSAITVDATLASFIVDQLNAGTNSSIISNTAGINITSPITTSSGTAALTFLANGTSALLDINANVNTGGAQTYRASAAGGTVTLEAGVTIQGGGTISLENRNGNVSGGSNAMNIAGQIGTTAKRQAVSFILSSAPNGFDSSLNLISGATIIATSVTGNALGFVITFPAGINWDVSGLLNFRADALGSVGQIHVTGDLGTSLLPIGSIQFQGGLAVPGAGLGNSIAVFDNGVNIYTTNLTVISVRNNTQIIINTVPNFHITGTLSLNNWGQASATGQVLITGTGALGTAPGQINAISLTGATTYPTPSVEIDAGAQLYANSLSIGSAGASSYVFLNNSTINAYHISGAMTVGSVITYVNGIIGAPGDLVGSLSLSGTSSLVLNAPTTGIMTSGAQTYSSNARLNSDQTMTNSTGTITFSGTVNNCPDATIGCAGGAGPFDLNVSSTSGSITFNTSIGNLAALDAITLSSPAGTTYITVANGGSITAASLNVTAATINYGPALTVTTTGNQTYNGPGNLQTFATNNNQVTINTTAGGSVTFNGTVSDTNPSTHGLVVTAAGSPAAGIYINANMLNLQKLILTAADKIYLNAPFIQVYGNQQGNNITMQFNSPVLLTGPTGIQTNQGSISFVSTLDGAQPFTVFNVNGQNALNGTLEFHAAVGSITPLASLSALAATQFGIIQFDSILNVTGNVILNVTHGFVAGTGTVQLNNAVTYTIGGSLTVNSNQGTINFNGPTINTQTGMFIDAYGVLQASTILTNGTSGNITINRSLNGDGVSSRSLTTNDAGGGSTVFNGIVGGSVPLSFIDVTGPVAINTTGITTTGLQIYRGAGTLGATTTLTSQTAGITFNSTLDGGFGLTTSVINGQSVTFNGAVGVGAALLSLTTSATGTTFINGGQIRTSSGTQNYNDPVFISANTILGGTGTTGAININSSLDSFDSTPRSLTLTTTAMTTLSGNLGNTNVLSALTVTNAVAIGANIHTVNDQLYSGAATLIVNPATPSMTTLTSDSGNITFSSTVNGAFNLTANAFGNLNLSGNVSIASLSATANNVNLSAASITTTGNQVYRVKAGLYVNNTITFNAGTITFDGTLNPSNNTAIFSAVTSVGPPIVTKAITINGNTIFNDMSGNGTVVVGGVTTYFFANDWMFNGTTTFMGPVGEVIDAQQTITFVGAVILNTDTSLGAGQEIWFKNTVQSSGGPFSLLLAASAGVVEFDGKVGSSTSASASNLNNLTVVASETDFTNSGIVDTNGAQYYTGAVKLFTDTVLTSVNAGITFTDTYASRFVATSTVDSDSAVIANARTLTLVSPLTVTLRGNIGSINKLKSLTIGSSSVHTEADINTSLINTVSDQHYFGPVVLGTNVTLQLSGGTLTFGGAVSGAHNLIIDPPAIVQFNGDVNTTSLNVTAGEIDINTANIQTSGDQTYNGPVVLQFNPGSTLTSTGGNITFNGTISGAFGLTIAQASTVNFADDINIGSLTIGNVIVNIYSTAITTATTQTYNNIVTNFIRTTPLINNTVTLTGSAINFNGPGIIFGVMTSSLTPDLVINGNVTLNNVTSNSYIISLTPFVVIRSVLNSWTINGTALFQGVGYFQFYQGLTFNGAVTLATDFRPATWNGGKIWFKSTVQSSGGGSVLSINEALNFPGSGTPSVPGVVEFDGQVGISTSLNPGNISDLNITASEIDIKTSGIINANGSQTYTGPVKLFTDTVMTSVNSGMTFNGTVNGNTAGGQSLQLVSPLTVTLSGNIGNNVALSALTIGSNSVATPAIISTPSITTTTAQTYFGPVTLNSPTMTLNAGITNSIAGTITFGSTIDATTSGAQGLTLNVNDIAFPFAPSTASFAGSVGGTVPLNFLTVNSDGITLNTNNTANFVVHTTGVGASPNGSQLYNDHVQLGVLGGNVTLASDNANIRFVQGMSGPFALTVNVPNGTFETSDVNMVGSIDVTGTTYLFANLVAFISASGTAIYNGPVIFGVHTALENPQLYGSSITINGSVYQLTSSPASQNFIQASTGSVTITGNIGQSALLTLNSVPNTSVGALSYLFMAGPTMTIQGSLVHTTNSQVYMGGLTFTNSSVTLTNDTNGPFTNAVNYVNGIFVTNAPALSFFGPFATSMTGASTDVIVAGDLYLGYAGITPVSVNVHSLTVNTGFITDIVGGDVVTTTLAQTYNGQVILDNTGFNSPVTLTGTSINFNNAVIQNPTVGTTPVDLIITGNMVANAVMGPSNISGGYFAGQNGNLKSLSVSGTSNLKAAGNAVTTTGTQTYTGAVTLDNIANINLTGSTINFNNTVNSKTTSTALTITGNLSVGPSGSIGLQFASPGNTQVASILVTGTTLGPNTNTSGNQQYNGAVTLNTDETMTSTAGSIIFNSTVNGDGVLPRTLTLNPNVTARFDANVGGIVPLNNLIINGPSLINGATTINTSNNQTYNGLVTLNNSIAMTAGSIGNPCLSAGQCEVSFTLGTIGSAGVFGPAFNLTVFTYDSANGPSGAGISGTVDVAGFTMGGTGGGNISPLVADYSTVGGSSGVGAWNNTVIDPLATGMYCVNGNCISGTRVLNIDANNDSKTYGQIITPNPVADVAKITVTGLATGDSITSVDLTSLGYPQTATVLGSPYAITASNASGPGLANHYTAIVYNNTPGQLTVNTAPLTVTADNVIKTYGQTTTFTGTEFTITSGTLFNGDNIASVTLNSPGASPTANVAGSPYTITPSAAVGTGLSNYTITYDPSGTITVNQAALTLTSDSQVKNYGTTLPSTTTAFTPSGLQNGETVGTVDITSAGLAPTANVAGSPYTIDTVSNAAGGTFDPNNYTISYVAAGTITVNPAPLNITSDPQTKTYGTTLPSTTTFFTPTGLQNGETIGTVDITSAGLAPTAGVAGSPYAITGVSNATGGTFDPNNYAITYTPANTITVTPAPLDILPDSIVKTYGDVIPSTTTGFTPTGLQNGETVGTIDISSAGLSPTASVLGGPYAIVGSNATGGTFDPSNYTINYLSGADITVNPAALTITSDPQTKVFGTNLPPTTTAFTPSGLQNGETIVTVDISSAGLVGSAPVGVYSIDTVSNATGGTFDPNNYNITYVAAGNITVIDSSGPIIPPNVPPTEEFIPPQGPGCGKAGCDNIWTIIFDPLNGFGIPDYIIVYPVTYAPENPNIVGVVTETDGPTSVAIDGNGNVRELKVGSVIYKEDTVVATETGCACIETQSHEKKCTHDTKNNPEWTNSCKANYLSKNKLNLAKNSSKNLPKKTSVVEATLKILEDHWWHYPLNDQDIFTR